ncbi:hypothetical protein R1flu_011802 [Riccia fluitans]|uniref:Uncharacterized protein n=1 Tax=Riccia fluitans TaxID=41844 RepID=A0ABD1Z906_9MARC
MLRNQRLCDTTRFLRWSARKENFRQLPADRWIDSQAEGRRTWAERSDFWSGRRSGRRAWQLRIRRNVRPAAATLTYENVIDHSVPSYFTATVVGSSQLGKTTMLNGLLRLFGYDQPCGRVFPDEDILPTQEKDRAGLPFPLRIEYHDSFQVNAVRWTRQELDDLMHVVASRALRKDPEFFEQLEFHEFDENSFMQLICDYGKVDEDGNFSCEPSVFETLKADGVVEEKCFPEETSSDHTLAATIKEVNGYLLEILGEQWFQYKSVTLRCPSRMLKEMGVDSCRPPCILDLPGVGIVHDNNLLVEELVRRNVTTADTIIVLTGQRSFTEDVLEVLRASVFQRLLDPTVSPPPTVAVTNSHMLMGLQNEEMETWRQNILHGSMGWYTELKRFAEENFSSRRRHRVLSEVEPSLFPNDLSGFLKGGAKAQDMGVATLIGYFMRLPQEFHLACVADVLERANAYKSTVDELWQAPMLVQKQTKHSNRRLFNLALAHQKEAYEMTLSSKLTGVLQKKMFNWEDPRSLDEQMDQIDSVADSELEKLHRKLGRLVKDGGSSNLHQEISSLVKQLLLEIAAEWDNVTGKVVFERFVNAAQQLAVEAFSVWVPQLFDERRSAEPDPKIVSAKTALLNALKAKVPTAISGSAIQYTLTDAYRQLVWNLDAKGGINLPRPRKGQYLEGSEEKVWSHIQTVVRKKISTLYEHINKNARHESTAVKQLISRLKILITETFTKCVEDFGTVTSALESIAQGEGAVNQNPIVILQKELLDFTTQLQEYLQKHKNIRNHFGEEELKTIFRARYGSQANNPRQRPTSEGQVVKRSRQDS